MTQAAAVYREALNAAQEQARELQAEITRLSHALDAKTAELGHVVNLAESLAALLDPGRVTAAQRVLDERRVNRPDGATDDETRERLVRGRALSHIRQALLADEPTQVELIVRWLFDTPGGLSRDSIEERFARHPVSEGWKDLKNSVSTAIWRAVRQKLIQQTKDDHFTLPLSLEERAKLEHLRRRHAT